MKGFSRCEMDDAGAPVLEDEEVVLFMHPDVDVYEGDTKTLRGGEASVTSFRVMYRQTGDGVVFAARLADVAEAERVSGYIVRSPKVKFTFSDGSEVRFSFQQGGQPEFWSHLDSARRRKSWEAAARVRAAKKQRPTFSTARAGVAGLIRSQQQQQQSRAQVASEAFSDLESLMAMARDVVAVCNAVAAEHDKQRRQRAQRENSQPSSSAAAAQGQAGAAGGAAASDAEGASLGALLRDVGLSSPVTREAAGALFHRELARQLASFLRAPMAAAGGTMTLTDVYCLYNRARGTDLVSPLDVRRGCELLPQTGAPFALRTFPSGVVVVTDDAAETGVQARLGRLLEEGRNGYLTPHDLAAKLGVSLPMAAEHLQDAERRGTVCRDECTHGVRFYPNRFV